ncbi:MAG: hypothetical protein ACRDYY_02375, partial [Acidimicrobiales bacterium]
RQEATIAKLQSTVTSLNETLAERDARVAELEDLLEESRRSGKLQAAPFRHGDPTEDPKRPGRKRGAAHGRHGHRLPPPEPDRSLEAALPDACPHCGEQIDHVRDAEQFEGDLPTLPPPATTRFNVAIGRCRSCGRRVQGRHLEQFHAAVAGALRRATPAYEPVRPCAWAQSGVARPRSCRRSRRGSLVAVRASSPHRVSVRG